MSWTFLAGLLAVLLAVLLVHAYRRLELRRMARVLDERAHARRRGSHAAQLQYPQVDLAQCVGCGSCVRACPEEGVLELIHGQAAVVHGARCVGHARCSEVCPVGAISVELADLQERTDIPVLEESLAVPGLERVYLAGEITGHALIETAVRQGRAVASAAAQELVTYDGPPATAPPDCDICIVGAGPAGLACALEAKAKGLRAIIIDQESLGGTVSKYPRRKLVLTRPLKLPLFGMLEKESYRKEELLELWERIVAEQELTVRTGVRFCGLERSETGHWRVETDGAPIAARAVCVAIGRRGSPRKLGIAGEELPKVSYALLDARAYTGEQILVVGGGDSAVEAAMALAEQEGNQVHISYRRAEFHRLRARNEIALEEALGSGRIGLLMGTQPEKIEPGVAILTTQVEGSAQRLELPNDEVFAFLGGEPPFELLKQIGVSFDPKDRPAPDNSATHRKSLTWGVAVSLLLTVATLCWALGWSGYYLRGLAERPLAPEHALLRPSAGYGLGFGIAAALLIVLNLAYLARRSTWIPLKLGSLRLWMTLHVGTGVLALLLAFLHAGMRFGDTLGGHACLALSVLVATGAIGRYIYAFIPRAANGRELALEEVQAQLARMSAEFDRAGGFEERVRGEIQDLVTTGHWSGRLFHKLWALVRSRAALRRTLQKLRRDARARGLESTQIGALEELVRRAQRAALAAAHYEDLRAFLGTWRHLHRWIALLMVLIAAAHVYDALRFSAILG